MRDFRDGLSMSGRARVSTDERTFGRQGLAAGCRVHAGTNAYAGSGESFVDGIHAAVA